jgi:alpha-L-fucosidase 2
MKPIAVNLYLRLVVLFYIIGLFAVPALGADGEPAGGDSMIWFSHPAKHWASEALPIGNGRLGAMLFGGVNQERIQFNEQSLWSGDNNWDGNYDTGDHGFGSYRDFGDVTIDWGTEVRPTAGATQPEATIPAEYRRALDITTGVHRTTFTVNGVTTMREAFASHPDQVMAFRYTANSKGAFTGRIHLKSAQGATTISDGAQLSFSGTMPNNLKYACTLCVENDGGSVTADGDALVLDHCDSIKLLVDARTDYKPDFKSGWRGQAPEPIIAREIAAAASKTYEQLLADHLADLAPMMNRVHLNLGATDPATLAMPTDERLKKYAAGGDDLDLEATIFQYGRYLLASCSRPGGLPANLQGLWNDSNKPAWASDYHTDINIQMNYWGAEPANLSECAVPLSDYVVDQLEPCRLATRKAFGDTTRGWTARCSQSIFGGNGWDWNIPASAWYCHHLFDHWDYTRDENYLRSTAYPVIKEVCQYWEDRLKRLPDGTLVAPNGWSPEHGPREDGVMMDQQIIWDLFQNYLDAARALGIDADYQKTIADLQSHLAPNKIGNWGQLQEWQTDRDDPKDTHRHTSMLFAVYPGRQITPEKTPDLANAAIVSLKARSNDHGDKPFTPATTIGDSRRSWTWPWRCAIWARLDEPERAHVMVRGLLTYNTTGNLFCNHPPFQMDGNFGITGAMAEMLLQSQGDTIQLLPALPAAWSANGSFTGLRARGGFTVDCIWQSGKVQSYTIHAAKPQKVRIRLGTGAVQEAVAQ